MEGGPTANSAHLKPNCRKLMYTCAVQPCSRPGHPAGLPTVRWPGDQHLPLGQRMPAGGGGEMGQPYRVSAGGVLAGLSCTSADCTQVHTEPGFRWGLRRIPPARSGLFRCALWRDHIFVFTYGVGIRFQRNIDNNESETQQSHPYQEPFPCTRRSSLCVGAMAHGIALPPVPVQVLPTAIWAAICSFTWAWRLGCTSLVALRAPQQLQCLLSSSNDPPTPPSSPPSRLPAGCPPSPCSLCAFHLSLSLPRAACSNGRESGPPWNAAVRKGPVGPS